METIATTATTIERGDGTPQGGGSLPTDIIWLAIGIVLLVGVFILLAVIAALQYKKRIKGTHTIIITPYQNTFMHAWSFARMCNTLYCVWFAYMQVSPHPAVS